jgi:hypothetical protein
MIACRAGRVCLFARKFRLEAYSFRYDNNYRVIEVGHAKFDVEIDCTHTYKFDTKHYV